MTRLWLLAIGLMVVFSFALATDPTPPNEKRVTYYPGHCSDPAGWYLYDSDDMSVTVACADDDPPVIPPSSDGDPDLK